MRRVCRFVGGAFRCTGTAAGRSRLAPTERVRTGLVPQAQGTVVLAQVGSRTCRTASAPPVSQNFSLPLIRRFIRLIVLSTGAEDRQPQPSIVRIVHALPVVPGTVTASASTRRGRPPAPPGAAPASRTAARKRPAARRLPGPRQSDRTRRPPRAAAPFCPSPRPPPRRGAPEMDEVQNTDEPRRHQVQPERPPDARRRALRRAPSRPRRWTSAATCQPNASLSPVVATTVFAAASAPSASAPTAAAAVRRGSRTAGRWPLQLPSRPTSCRSTNFGGEARSDPALPRTTGCTATFDLLPGRVDHAAAWSPARTW